MANQQQVAAIYVELQANIAKFKSALNEATAESRKFSQEMKAHTEEANGSLELLGDQFGVRLPRHLRSFVAELPGVATAMSAAFSGIAIIGIIQILTEAGEKVAAFIEKTREAGEKHKETWQGITGAITLQNEQLQVTNDKLEDSIAKLEHKPENRIKEAIDEAILSADTLGRTLDDDLKKLTDGLKEEQTGLIGWLAGKSSNSVVTEHARQLQTDLEQIQSAGQAQLAALRSHNATQAEIDKAQQQIDEQQKARVDRELSTWAQPQLAKAQSDQQRIQAVAGIGSFGQPLVTSLTDYVSDLSGASNAIGLSEQNTQDTQRLGVDQGKNDAANALKLAQEQMLKQLDAQLTAEKQYKTAWAAGWTATDDMEFWRSHIDAFTKGSDAYNKVQQHIYADQQDWEKKFAALRKSLSEGSTQPPPQVNTQHADDQLLQAQTRDAEAHARAAAQFQLEGDKIAYANGQLSAHSFAMAETAEHTAEYKAQLAPLQSQLEELHKNDFGSFSTENTAKEQAVQTQINSLVYKQQTQAMEDAQNEFNNTWKGSITSIYDTVIQKANDTAKQITQISNQFIDGINNEFVNGLMGKRMNFSKVFENSAQSLAKTGLEKGEGAILGSLGLGKRDGSSVSQALWVQITSGGTSGLDQFANLPTGQRQVLGPSGSGSIINSAAGMGASGLLGMLNNSNFFSSMFGGRLFGSGGLFGGHFASGGDVMGGVPIDVGELGPERFVPYTNGRIVPNKELGKSGPSIGYIDARGTDPVQTQQAIMRGMAVTHAQAVADAQHQMADRQRRLPH